MSVQLRGSEFSFEIKIEKICIKAYWTWLLMMKKYFGDYPKMMSNIKCEIFRLSLSE